MNLSSEELMGTFAQRELDKVSERMEVQAIIKKESLYVNSDNGEIVSLHSIYCSCERCIEARANEKQSREKK